MKALAVTAVCMFVAVVHAQQICKKDSDCEALGKLECIKSMCDWGICSCERGKIAMFAGSEKNFVCVPLRRIDQTCSQTGLTGLCGAPNSYCKDGECKCDDRNNTLKYGAHWGGEICVPIEDTSKYSGEAYSPEGIGECVSGTQPMAALGWTGAFETLQPPNDLLPNSPLDGVPSVCACERGYHTAIPNFYGTSEFVGGNSPSCIANQVGNLCLMDTDCIMIKHWNDTQWVTGEATCKNNKCTCQDGKVEDITGIYCGDPLLKDTLCYVSAEGMGGNVSWIPLGTVCNGRMGLRCGDPCSLEQLTNLTCVCDPLTTDERGGSCKQKEGIWCSSDAQCSGITGGKCIGGECKIVNSAPVQVPATLMMTTVALVVTAAGQLRDTCRYLGTGILS